MEQSNFKGILEKSKTIAVVGMSAHPFRPSNGIAKFMHNKGYTILPVNPNYDTIWKLRCYNTLLDLPEMPDIVNIFRRPAAVPEVVDQAIEIGAKIIWMQLGVIHSEAAQKARDAGITVITDRCIKIEYARMF